MGQGDVAESIDIIMQSKEFFGKAVYRYIAATYNPKPIGWYVMVYYM
jgi:hypothetical protein